MDTPNVKILVCYHKPAPHINSDVFTPIHVGRALASHDVQGELDFCIGDDTGENISRKNRNYCELTAMYWAWKNPDMLGNPDFVGLQHYRRLFNFRADIPGERGDWLFDDFSETSRYRFGWNDDFTRRFCSSYDIIVDRPWGIDKQSVIDTATTYGFYSSHLAKRLARMPEKLSMQDHYVSIHRKEDLSRTISIVKRLHPEMAPALDRTLKSKTGHFMNMVVLRRELFDLYCEWLFGVLDEVERQTDLEHPEYDSYQRRVFGFLGERLLNVFINHADSNVSPPLVGQCQALWARETPEDTSSSQSPQESDDQEVHVAFALDEGFAAHTSVAMTSMLINSNPDTRIHFHILDGGLSEGSKQRIEALTNNVGNCDLEIVPIEDQDVLDTFTKSAADGDLPWASGATFYRLLLPSLLPDVDRVLYLDGDIVVRHDLSKLFNTDLGSDYVAMASDVYARAEVVGSQKGYFSGKLGVEDDYFNAGVTLYDLARMRNDGIQEKLLSFLVEQGPFRFVDQDVVNSVLRGRITKLDQTWNMTQGCWHFDPRPFTRHEVDQIRQRQEDPAIVHFAGEAKPWSFFSDTYEIPFGSEYWRYYSLSPWGEIISETEYDEDAPFLSIIIPTYNVEELLPCSLNSVMKQTVRNIEIIVIDDGSTDGSVKVAESFASRDPRIRVIKTPHQGVSAARNAGMEVACGEYIGFVDADDWVHPTMFEKLYKRAMQTESDIVISDISLCYGDGKRENLRDQGLFYRNHRDVFSIAESPEVLWCVGAWDKIYRRSLLENHGIVFPVGLFYEDHIFGYQALVKAKRIGMVWEQLYYYRKARESSTTFKEKKDDGLKMQYVEIVRKTREFFINEGDYDEFRDALLPVQFLFATFHFRNCRTKSSAREFFDALRSFLNDEDYASLAKVGRLGLEPVSFFANCLARNRFQRCYYLMKFCTARIRTLKAVARCVPSGLRRCVIAFGKRFLPDRVKQAIVRFLPKHIMRALANT